MTLSRRGFTALLGSTLLIPARTLLAAPMPAAHAALYEAAKKEGELTWYCAHYTSEQAERAGREFTQLYPGVKVNVVTPGYVKTPMGGVIKGWRPLEMSADEAAARIAKGLERDQDVIAFPAILAALARGALLVPEWLRSAGLSGFRFRNRPRR